MFDPKSPAAVNDEIDALRTILSALTGLEQASRVRVLALVDQYYRSATTLGTPTDQRLPETQLPTLLPTPPQQTDIRSLKDNKRPGNAVEMAALVAYYLAELAPESEQTKALTRALLTKYFKQASYPLPKHPNMTLVHAKNAGYLDSAGSGSYQLNPVGYNLVAHGLPRKGGEAQTTQRLPKDSKRGTSRRSKPAGTTKRKVSR